MERTIDIVIPYVNNFDEVWREEYVAYCKSHNAKGRIEIIDKERFRDFGYLKFLFRGIAQNMPFIRNVYLVVSNVEQVPEWVNTEIVQVVLHKDFIPKEYLPTFNSTTIEMFIPEINGLSENFIYGNDDIFVINPTTEDDYFTTNGEPKIRINKVKRELNAQYWEVCYQNWLNVLTVLGKDIPTDDGFGVPDHSLTPINKTLAREIRYKLNDKIVQNISAFRTNTNFNQYIYSLYAYYSGNCADSQREVRYINMGRKHANTVVDTLTKDNGTHELILNDTETTDKSYWRRFSQVITNAFLHKLSNKCKYEK